MKYKVKLERTMAEIGSIIVDATCAIHASALAKCKSFEDQVLWEKVGTIELHTIGFIEPVALCDRCGVEVNLDKALVIREGEKYYCYQHHPNNFQMEEK